MSHNAILNIVVALHCEAKPLISFFKLKKIVKDSLPFAIFINTDKTICLIVSGIGKIKAAVATTFLAMYTNNHPYATFLNLGIAGSTEFPIGCAVLANKIVEQSTTRCNYPFVSLLKNQTQTTLITHDHPQINYPSKGMVDMEGSAFFQTAAEFVTQEQILILKVISDNNLSSQDKITPSQASELISDNMPTIGKLVAHLLYLSQKEAHLNLALHPPLFSFFCEKWHFTFNQTIQLKELLRKWFVTIPIEDPLQFCFGQPDAATVLTKIREKLNEYYFDIRLIQWDRSSYH